MKRFFTFCVTAAAFLSGCMGSAVVDQERSRAVTEAKAALQSLETALAEQKLGGDDKGPGVKDFAKAFCVNANFITTLTVEEIPALNPLADEIQQHFDSFGDELTLDQVPPHLAAFQKAWAEIERLLSGGAPAPMDGAAPVDGASPPPGDMPKDPGTEPIPPTGEGPGVPPAAEEPKEPVGEPPAPDSSGTPPPSEPEVPPEPENTP